MELTPTNRSIRPRHVPTPKLSERKKKLFVDAKETSTTTLINNVIDEGDEDSDLGPMSPLEFSSSPSNFQRLNSIDSNDRFMNKSVRTDFKNILSHTSPALTPTHSNTMNDSDDDGVAPLCTSMKKMTSVSDLETSLTNIDCLDKENYAQQMKTPNELNSSTNTADQLLRGLSFRKSLIFDTGMTPHDDITQSGKVSEANESSSNEHPKAKTSLTFSEPLISARSFYGSSHSTDATQVKKADKSFSLISMIKPKSTKAPTTKKVARVKAPSLWRHGAIFKKSKHKSSKAKLQQKQRQNKMKMKAIKSLIKNSSASSDFGQINDENKLNKDHDESTANKSITSTEHNKRLQRILRDQRNPLNSARTINWNVRDGKDNTDSFYASDNDVDGESDDEEENNEPHLKQAEDVRDDDDHNGTQSNRKFFKSKSNNTAKKYCILSGINATLKRGCDLKLERPAKRKKRSYVRRQETVVLQTEITSIIDRLTSPSKSKSPEDPTNDVYCEKSPNKVVSVAAITTPRSDVAQQQPESFDDAMDKYRKMIPYRTDDPQKMSQQESILELLISNGICDDETFKIFIAEPDSHKQQAEKILDSLYCVTSFLPEQTEDQIEYENGEWRLNTGGDMLITGELIDVNNRSELSRETENVLMSPASQISNMTSSLALDCMDDPQKAGSSTSLYPIFNKDHRPKPNRELFLNTHNSLKRWRPIGNQYQIDAGQKEFGMKVCPQCEMHYSAHEPEDELLHIKYHNSLRILTFKGWADERLVTEIAEWGVNGRIIFVCENDQNKQSRVEDVMSVVDRDLGFAEISLPPRSLIYFAIIKSQIAGVCVVHPLTEAHRLITENELDCCTLESYPAKMGISRIWVAPPFRNYGVATTTITSIRGHFIFGTYLNYDEIAFSSPTEVGKKLAAKLAGRPDFLIYEHQ